MEDALDEADEIYRSVNEGFTSQDQEFLMDLFAEDDPDYNDDTKYHTNQHELKDPQNRDDTQLTELDAEIDKIDFLEFLDSQEDHDSMASGSSGRSNRSKRPFDALDIEKDLDPNEETQALGRKSIALTSSQNDYVIDSSRSGMKSRAAYKMHPNPRDQTESVSKESFRELDGSKALSQKSTRRNVFHIQAKLIREHFNNQLYQFTDYRKIQWYKLTPADFINWPDDLPIKSPGKFNKDELVILSSQLKKIRFSDNYLEKQNYIDQKAQIKKMKDYKQQYYSSGAKTVSQHFKNLLSSNSFSIERIKWKKMNCKDFVNWPANLPMKSPHRYNSLELKILLSNLKNLRFSDSYLQHLKAIEFHTGTNGTSTVSDHLEQKKKIILEYFKNQLKENNILGHSVKWSQLKKEDMINWPEDLPIKYPKYYKRRELIQLLSHLDNIRFTDKYLQDTRNQFSQKSLMENKTPAKKYAHKISFQRKLVNSHFQNLLQSNGIKPKLLLWSKLKKDDFINWPDNLPIKAPSSFNVKEFKTILSHLDQIRFTEKYLEQYKALNFL